MSALDVARPGHVAHRDPARRYDLRADVWEATAGSRASRLVDDHLRAAAAILGRPLRVMDLGAGTGRALDRLARLDLSVDRYHGVERDPAMVAAAASRTGSRPTSQVTAGCIEHVAGAPTGTNLVLLAWVLSVVGDPAAALATARRLAGADGLVVVAAVTGVHDRPALLDGWIRRRWAARPVDPTMLTPHATRFDVTLRGRAVVATLRGDATASTGMSRTTSSVRPPTRTHTWLP